MGFYNNEELPFVKKCEGIILDAKYSNKITLLRFLNQREIEILNQLKDDTLLYIDSCGDEYKRVIISPFEIKPEFKTVLLKLNYNKKYLDKWTSENRRHLMNSSIKRYEADLEELRMMKI